MFRLSRRNLRSDYRRMLACAIAIALGVSFLVGSLVMTDTVKSTFTTLMTDFYSGPDAVVRGPENKNLSSGDGSTPRDHIPASAMASVLAVPGVESAAGVILGEAAIVGPDRKVISSTGPTFGYNWIDNAVLNKMKLVKGHAPTGPNEIAVDAGSAKKAKLKLGDAVTVLTTSFDINSQPKYNVVGIVNFGKAESAGGTTAAIFDTATAQKVMGRNGSFDLITAVAKKGTSQIALRDSVKSALATGAESKRWDVVTGNTRRDEQITSINKSIGQLGQFFTMFAAIAMFVGTFVIYNAFTIVGAHRMRTSALLRAIGASGRQVTLAQLAETVLVAVLSPVAGAALGIGIGRLLKALLESLGGSLPPGPIVVLPRTLIIGVVVGVVITMLSAMMPALRAGRIPPVTVMRARSVEIVGSSLRRVLFGGALAVVAAAALLRSSEVASSGMTMLAALLIMVLALIVSGPILATPVTKLLGSKWVGGLVVAFGGAIVVGGIAGAVLAHGPVNKAISALGALVGVAVLRIGQAAFGITGTLARLNAARSPKRTATTGMALTIGVGVLSAFGVLLASQVETAIADDRDGITADYVVNDRGPSGVNDSIVNAIKKIPGVAVANARRFTDTSVNGKTTTIKGVEIATLDQITNLGSVEGSLESLRTSDAVAVPRAVAKKRNIKIGDTLSIGFGSDAARPVKVAAIFASAKGLGFNSDMLADQSLLNRYVPDAFASYIGIRLAPGADAVAFRAATDKLLTDMPLAKLSSKQQLLDSNVDGVRPTMTLIGGLLLLSLIIATLGIANTIRLSIMERVREIGILRALGMDAPKVRAAIRWESVVVSMFGGLVGLVAGAAFGIAMVRHNEMQLKIPFQAIPAAWFGVIAVGLFASHRASKSASRVDILGALAAV